MQLQTNEILELLCNLDLLNMIENMQRGGLCFVGSKWHVQGDSQNTQDYDPNKQSTHIIYEDANGLAGCRMSEFLLHKSRKFDHNVQLDEILSTPDEHGTGYALEVDLHFPVVLHDKFKECPPAPEGFVLEAGRDAPGYNLGENRAEERHPGNVPAIARRCAARWNCRSFNLEGWVKSVLSTVYRPGACFYIKQGA